MEAFVHITGYAGTEVELRSNSSGGAARTSGSPARRGAAKGGEWGDGNTTWMTVTCLRSLAEHVAKSIRKGDPGHGDRQAADQCLQGEDGVLVERLILEAATLGHDLNRGTSIFSRSRAGAIVREGHRVRGAGGYRGPKPRLVSRTRVRG